MNVSDSALMEEAELQRDLAVRAIVKDQERLARVHTNIATKAHRLCGKDLAPSTGAVFLSKSASDLSPSYEKLYGITEKPTVLLVLKESRAGAAGLQPRDVITHINDMPVPTMEKLDEVYKTLGAEDPIRARIIRNGNALAVNIMPEKACKYPSALNPSQALNAFADKNRIVVTRGMMDFAKDDFELSLVIAHELAHLAMHHMDVKSQNKVGDFFVEVLAAIAPTGQAWTNLFSTSGVSSFSQEFEAEADYVGMYVVAAAGLPFDDAPSFWRRMAAANPSNIKAKYGASHPSTSYRVLALEATAKEIKAKLEMGQPIEPNTREGRPVRTWH